MKRILALALAASVVFGFAATPALAHDEVVSTTPATGSSVDAGSVDVSIVFNEDIMPTADEAGKAIVITDPSGNKLTGCPMTDGATLMGSFILNDAGTYTVEWRSVSNDGHPNEGSFTFDVTAAATPSTDGNSAFCAKAMTMSGMPGVGVSTPAPTAVATTNDPFMANLPFLFFGVALVVLGAVAGPITQKLRTRRAAQRAALKKLREES